MSEATIKYIKAPLSAETVKELRAGDVVRISGYIYTARDAAHKRLTEALARGEELPLHQFLLLQDLYLKFTRY